jgi:hypothetical protein
MFAKKQITTGRWASLALYSLCKEISDLNAFIFLYTEGVQNKFLRLELE